MIITFDPPRNIGGVEGRARAYSEELLRRGHYVEIVSFAAGSKNNFSIFEEDFHGTKLSVYPSRTKFVPRSLREVANKIRREKIDRVFLLSGTLTLFGITLLAYCRIARIKTGIFLYGKDILETTTKPFDRLAFYLSPLFSKRVLVNSIFTRSLLPRVFRRKARILYPGIDPKAADLVFTSVNDPTVSEVNNRKILFVGRLVKRKGVDDLLAAFTELRKVTPGIQLEIVGDGPDLQRLLKLRAELALNSSEVIFCGRLVGKDLASKYSEAEIFAMPSRRTKTDVEGFGTVFLEAGLFGKPSVGTRSGGIPEAVLDGETGILVDEGDVKGIKNALERLLSDPSLRSRLGSEATKRTLTKFTWANSTDSLVEAMS